MVRKAYGVELLMSLCPNTLIAREPRSGAGKMELKRNWRKQTIIDDGMYPPNVCELQAGNCTIRQPRRPSGKPHWAMCRQQKPPPHTSGSYVPFDATNAPESDQNMGTGYPQTCFVVVGGLSATFHSTQAKSSAPACPTLAEEVPHPCVCLTDRKLCIVR